jgi:hypothetical protein
VEIGAIPVPAAGVAVAGSAEHEADPTAVAGVADPGPVVETEAGLEAEAQVGPDVPADAGHVSGAEAVAAAEDGPPDGAGVEPDTADDPGAEADTSDDPRMESDSADGPGVESDTADDPRVESDTADDPGAEVDAADDPGAAEDAGPVPGDEPPDRDQLGDDDADFVVGAATRPLGAAPLLDSKPLPATMPGMLRPRTVEEFSLPAQRPAFEVGPEQPADLA